MVRRIFPALAFSLALTAHAAGDDLPTVTEMTTTLADQSGRYDGGDLKRLGLLSRLSRELSNDRNYRDRATVVVAIQSMEMDLAVLAATLNDNPRVRASALSVLRDYYLLTNYYQLKPNAGAVIYLAKMVASRGRNVRPPFKDSNFYETSLYLEAKLAVLAADPQSFSDMAVFLGLERDQLLTAETLRGGGTDYTFSVALEMFRRHKGHPDMIRYMGQEVLLARAHGIQASTRSLRLLAENANELLAPPLAGKFLTDLGRDKSIMEIDSLRDAVNKSALVALSECARILLEAQEGH